MGTLMDEINIWTARRKERAKFIEATLEHQLCMFIRSQTDD